MIRHRRVDDVDETRNDRPEAGIEVRGLSKVLRGRTILDDLDLVIPRGTAAALDGDNGAGKTTLIRILASVVSPDAGVVRVNGFDVSKQSIHVRRSIGVSFANERSLYWRISGFENLELFGKIAGLPKAVIVERAGELLEALHLTDMAAVQVARMSTGQRQRLMVARALLTNPEVVLLDEPFRGLDEDGLKALLDLVDKRVRFGVTALIVAPQVDAVLPIADTTYRIEDGKVFATPASRPTMTPTERM